MKFIIIVAKIHCKKIKLVPRYLYTSIYKVLNKQIKLIGLTHLYEKIQKQEFI